MSSDLLTCLPSVSQPSSSLLSSSLYNPVAIHKQVDLFKRLVQKNRLISTDESKGVISSPGCKALISSNYSPPILTLQLTALKVTHIKGECHMIHRLYIVSSIIYKAPPTFHFTSSIKLLLIQHTWHYNKLLIGKSPHSAATKIRPLSKRMMRDIAALSMATRT